MNLPDLQEMEQYIRSAASQRGIDPNIAVRVARSEGLAPNTWQSNVVKNGRRETSYGPFQLLVGGGLGDKFIQQTGYHPSDPNSWRQQVDFAMDEAKQGGWSPWYGAKAVGIGQWGGIGEGGTDAHDLGVAPVFGGARNVGPSGSRATAGDPQGSPKGVLDAFSLPTGVADEIARLQDSQKKPGGAQIPSVGGGGGGGQVPKASLRGGGDARGRANDLLAALSGPTIADYLLQYLGKGKA